MRLKLMVPVTFLLLAAFAGCEQARKPDQKSAAHQNWGRARANVLCSLAKEQYNTGNFDAARKSVNEGLGLDADNEPLHVLSARLAIEGGQLDLADRELGLARKLNAKDPEADYLSGVVYQRWQKPDVAFGYYAAATDKNPDELAYLLAKSEMLTVLGRQEEALRLLQSRVTYFEHSAVIRDAVGQLLVQFKKYDDASIVLREASILDPKDLTIQEHLALALFFGHQYKEAIEPLQKLLKNDAYAKRADLYLALGQCLMEIHKGHDARAALETAVQLDGQEVGAWLALGRVSLQQNDLARAELSVKRAVAIDPARADARLLMGYIRLRQGKTQEALNQFQRATAIDSSDTVSLCMIGYTLQQLGRTNEALRYYAQALKIKPGDEMAARMMASLDKD